MTGFFIFTRLLLVLANILNKTGLFVGNNQHIRQKCISYFTKCKRNYNKMEEKQLFEIDGYRIWAYTYEEAYEQYLRIKRF